MTKIKHTKYKKKRILQVHINIIKIQMHIFFFLFIFGSQYLFSKFLLFTLSINVLVLFSFQTPKCVTPSSPPTLPPKSTMQLYVWWCVYVFPLLRHYHLETPYGVVKAIIIDFVIAACLLTFQS
jgi:hypothetical protein